VHPSVKETFDELQTKSTGAPLLALGQTVFWDEPLKIALPMLAEMTEHEIELVAGIHDTDYFAKIPGGVVSKAPYVILPKNDGSTKGFWSSAAEFSALFGGETPLTKERYAEAGVSLEKLAHGDESFIDKWTEAWGWRGIAQSDSSPQVSCEISIHPLFPFLQSALDWAFEETLRCLCEPKQLNEAREVRDKIHTLLCDTLESCTGDTLSEFYECLLPRFHKLLVEKLSIGQEIPVTITRTTKLLRFTRETAYLPRFDFVNLFLMPDTKDKACEIYNRAVSGTEIYSLDRFGTGAIPFDLVIPNVGRGTLRITPKMLVVMTPRPRFAKLRYPIENVFQLAEVTQEAFGECVLIGKAVTLISMLSREFVFAFHETASPYLKVTREFHSLLRQAGFTVKSHPILRIAHETWDSLASTDRWFRLPKPLCRPFGAEHVSAHTFASTWRKVVEQQKRVLKTFGKSKKRIELIRALGNIMGGKWRSLAEEYEDMCEKLEPLRKKTWEVRKEIAKRYERLREIKREWQRTQEEQGDHFRKVILGQNPSSEALAERRKFSERIANLQKERGRIQDEIRELRRNLREFANSSEMYQVKSRRMEIEREAEYARLEAVHDSLITCYGLERAHNRPCAWWMAMVSPNGDWFKSMVSNLRLRLEEL